MADPDMRRLADSWFRNDTKERGFIHHFRALNAAAMALPHGVFDFVLCKESYHPFPRLMLAFYEMLRVARAGVVLIESNNTPSLGSLSHLANQAGSQC